MSPEISGVGEHTCACTITIAKDRADCSGKEPFKSYIPGSVTKTYIIRETRFPAADKPTLLPCKDVLLLHTGNSDVGFFVILQ